MKEALGLSVKPIPSSADEGGSRVQGPQTLNPEVGTPPMKEPGTGPAPQTKSLGAAKTRILVGLTLNPKP